MHRCVQQIGLYAVGVKKHFGREAYMTQKERELLAIIRESKHPAVMMTVAVQAITACLRPPAPCESPCLAAPASAAGTDP